MEMGGSTTPRGERIYRETTEDDSEATYCCNRGCCFFLLLEPTCGVRRQSALCQRGRGCGVGEEDGGRGCMGGDGTRGKWHGTSMCNYAKQLFHMLSEGLCKRARAHPHSTDCVYDDPPLKITQLSSGSACKTPVQTWTLVFTILVTMMLLYQ